MPIGHSHEHATDTRNGTLQLSRHLNVCHPDGCFSGRDADGWHIHWIVRAVGYAGINAEELACHASFTDLVPTDGPRVWVQYELMPGRLDVDLSPRTLFLGSMAGSFLQVGMLQSRRSMPELLGVMRC